MRILFFGLWLLPVCAAAQSLNPTVPLKVKIEASELDKKLLLEKLRDHGKDHRLTFDPVDSGFDYRIEFDTFQHRNTGATLAGAMAVHFSGSEVKVYDNQGKLLFSFTRETRYTDAGATNAAAKEIIKRLLRLGSQRRE